MAAAVDPRLIEIAFEHAGVGLCLVGADYRVIRTNEEWSRFCGIPADQIAGTDFRDLCPAHPNLVVRLAARARAEKRVRVARLRRFIEGQESWWSLEVSALPSDHEVVFLMTARDVSQQQRAEASLRASNQALREKRAEWHRARQALTEAEQRSCTLIESVRDVICTFSLDGTITSLNPFFETATGRRTADWIGKRYRDLLHPEDVPVAEVMHSFIRSGKVPPVTELRILTQFSGCRIAEVCAAPLFHEGSVVGTIAVARDVTDRKLMGEALRESQEKHRVLLNCVQSPVLAVSSDMTVLYCNEAYGSYRGMSVPDIEGKNLHDLIPNVRQTPTYAAYREVLVTKEPREVEGWAPTTYMQARIYPTPWGVLAIAEDETERKEAELEREELLAKLRQANEALAVATVEARQAAEEERRRASELDCTINSMANGIIVCNRDGEIIRLNSVAQRLMALCHGGPASGLQECFAQLQAMAPNGEPIPPQRLPPLRALEGETVFDELVGIPTGATTAWLSFCAAPIRSTNGEMLGAVTTIVDVTAQREFQEQREDLLRVISHELMTPLAVILGTAQVLPELIGKPGKSALVKTSLRAVEDSARRILATVEDTSYAVRSGAGRLQAQKTRVNLAGLASSISGLLGIDGARRISVAIPPDLPDVVADPGFVERVLTNLLANSLKYSNPDSTILLEAREAPGEVLISVTDQGPGIPSEELPLLFRRFHRSPDSRRARGLGLGLYISKLLVEAQEGRIWAESRQNEGSTFSFTLPMANDY